MKQRQNIRVLFLEDNPDDVELELYELRKGGLNVRHNVARSRAEFMECLASPDYDIIIADYNLADITGIEAIHICRRRGIEIPIILITGIGNERVAVDSLREGAIDYILKNNIEGFSARVVRALAIWAEHREKEQLRQQLFHMQKMESIGTLASGIAHDFNNILTGIMVNATMSLKDIPAESRSHERVRSIVDMGRRGNDLTRQLLVFGRKQSLDFTITDMNRFINDTTMFVRRMVEAPVDIRVTQDGSGQDGSGQDGSGQDGSGMFIRADKGQLTQVMMNLILNARDAMNGEGTVEIRTSRVPSGDGGQEFARLDVADTGSGISEEHIAKIFDPFFTTKEVGKGTGLGLSIVYSIVKAHGGQVEVKSRAGEGTTFSLYLPLVDAGITETLEPLPEQFGVDSAGGHETILFVEDDAIVRTVSESMLADMGYHVITASDGDEAIGIYERRRGEINLVISDYFMPRKSGADLFHALRAVNPDVKFILITGYYADRIDAGIADGMTCVLLKPYTTEGLAQAVRKTLDKTGDS
ncbi:MAG: response regulator [Nitrospirae bacterium]|nr:response regulator [Nitrospirota bacterium]